MLNRIANDDIDLKELTVGVSDLESKLAGILKAKGVPVFGVRKACDEAVTRINDALNVGN